MDEAAAWFIEAIQGSDQQCMLFLVGGPGAGKSHVSSRVVHGLKRIDSQADGLAYRKYQYRTAHSELVLVNDATIGGDIRHPRPLMQDVLSCLDSGRHMMACVNRGVLVEELRNAAVAIEAGDSLDPRCLAILDWLGPTAGTLQSPSLVGLQRFPAPAFLQVARLAVGDGRDVLMVSVHVDACSLLERRPSCTLRLAGAVAPDATGEDYLVRRFHERISDSAFITSATALMGDVVAAVEGAAVTTKLASEFIDPFAANVESLSSEKVRKGVECILRAAEVRGSRRFSYRSLWGAIARSLVGDMTDRVESDGLESWLADHQPDSADDLERFEQMRQLAARRFSEGIFGVCCESDAQSRTENPVTSLTSLVDPIIDATPGIFDGSPSSGWATPLMDAFAGQAFGGTPLENLMGAIAEDDGLREGVTQFDYALDLAFGAAVASPSLTAKRAQNLIGWYGAYLTRLYAVCNGIPAYRSEIALWTNAWHSAPSLPQALSKNLPTLLLPKRDPQESSSSQLLPILDARTTPVSGRDVDTKLAIRVSQVDVSSRRSGDNLSVILREDGRVVGELELDFAMIREALSCEEGRIGITEQSSAASPRLERIRAASLVSTRADQRSYCFVFGDHEEAFSVGGFS